MSDADFNHDDYVHGVNLVGFELHWRKRKLYLFVPSTFTIHLIVVLPHIANKIHPFEIKTKKDAYTSLSL